jgi:hypothetical protein
MCYSSYLCVYCIRSVNQFVPLLNLDHGANDNEAMGHPWTWCWGGFTLLFQPSLVGISGCKETCGCIGIPRILWWGWGGGLSGGGQGWNVLFCARLKKPICRSWLNSSESTSKWIEKQSLLLPQKSLGLLPLPLFPLPPLPLLKKLIYKYKIKFENVTIAIETSNTIWHNLEIALSNNKQSCKKSRHTWRGNQNINYALNNFIIPQE